MLKSPPGTLLFQATSLLLVGSVAACDGGATSAHEPGHELAQGRYASVASDLRDTTGGESADAEESRQPAPMEVEPGLTGEHLYIIHFEDAPLAMYGGGIPGLAATSPAATGRRNGRLDTRSPASRAYERYLDTRQGEHVRAIARATGRGQIVRSYKAALDAVTMRMTQDEAMQVARLPGVTLVERDQALEPATTRSPEFIGASAIWSGAQLDDVVTLGEGMVVGIIDTGIAIQVELDGVLTHHPSFAAVAGDGYVHQRPHRGAYLGACAESPAWCNDKLIGVYSFLHGQPVPGHDPAAPTDDPVWRYKDTSGHGSHVASTVAGNVLFDVPTYDVEGTAIPGVSFDRVSGVAPRASIIAYKVCAPSCYNSDIAAAVEQAIADGVVDVLNMSISSPKGSPWNGTSAKAFLAARAAGIFVATSAGNSGPGAGTAAVTNSAPWITSVGATTHDRTYAEKQLTGLSGGDAPPPALSGRAVSDGITGRIVHAKDFPVGSPGEPNFDQPEQCLEPFPAGTFAPDMIVYCDRGTIARVAKGQNVRDGGAGGLILGNLAVSGDSTNFDAHVLPAIHLDDVSADVVRAWLSTGTDHRGTITPTPPSAIDPAAGDDMARFSSRGPYTGFDFLAPVVSAPGVTIFAAGAQVLFDHPGSPSVPALFGEINGTSMASPHVAGAATLLRSLHPDWTAAEVQSALMTTGATELVKHDGITPADPFDHGGGRVRVDVAARAGLVLDELPETFLAANPASGGDPATLNVAALVQDECAGGCAWQRTVRATRAGTWKVESTGFMRVTPGQLTLSAGETRTLTIEASGGGLSAGEHRFGQVLLIPTDKSVGKMPLQRIQVAIRAEP